MKKILIGAISAAALIAVNAGFAAADDTMGSNYATCTTRTSDRCIQPEGGKMMPSNAPMKKMGAHKMMKGAMKMKTGGTSMMGGGDTHGCSPATTPCQ